MIAYFDVKGFMAKPASEGSDTRRLTPDRSESHEPAFPSEPDGSDEPRSAGVNSYLVGNVRLEFFRTQLTRFLIVTAGLALPAMYLSPILGLLLFPSSLLTLYWLQDNVRFQHGGDVRRCVTRDCSAMFLQICASAAWIIASIDVVVICFELAKPGQDSEAARTVHRHVTADTPQPRGMRMLQLILNVALVVVLVGVIHFCHGLRKILNSVPLDIVHA